MPAAQRTYMFLLIAIIGFAIFFVAAALAPQSGSIRYLLYDPFVVIGMAIAAVVTVGALLLWSRASNQVDRKAFITAILAVAGFAVLFEGIAPVMGWFGGTSTHIPLLMQALIYGMSLAGLSALPLSLYRWLKARCSRLVRVIYPISVLIVIPALIFGDPYLLASGVITFQHGYTIFTDILYGLTLLLGPLIIYEGIRSDHQMISDRNLS